VGYISGRVFWPWMFAPPQCVSAGNGCGLAFLAGILALILNWKRWRWWLCLAIVSFVSFFYIEILISDI